MGFSPLVKTLLQQACYIFSYLIPQLYAPCSFCILSKARFEGDVPWAVAGFGSFGCVVFRNTR